MDYTRPTERVGRGSKTRVRGGKHGREQQDLIKLSSIFQAMGEFEDRTAAEAGLTVGSRKLKVESLEREKKSPHFQREMRIPLSYVIRR